MKAISDRCGKGKCPYYDKHNKVSGCKLFASRLECTISCKHRKSVAKTSKNRPYQN